MISFKQKLLELIKEEEGLTTVEYAIAGSLVGAAVVASFDMLGEQVGTVIDGICQDINDGTACTPPAG